ncbi:hypothetical protein LIER_14872 [Lithospermum erythrorhizon]|uniref:Uncharacterized protein n=1 Tax=Lithospermum erythrorhizon TaxID=34254 RepID=A0AAV3Q132_LITER
MLGDLIVKHVPTQMQLADVRTKPLASSKFATAVNNLCLMLPAQIEGGCKQLKIGSTSSPHKSHPSEA